MTVSASSQNSDQSDILFPSTVSIAWGMGVEGDVFVWVGVKVKIQCQMKQV